MSEGLQQGAAQTAAAEPQAPVAAQASAPAMTSQQAVEEIDRLKADANFRRDLLSPMNAGHKHATRTMQRLHQIAYGDPSRPAQPAEDDGMRPVGVPESPDKYRIPPPQYGEEHDAELVASFKGWAHAIGADQGLVDGLVHVWDAASRNPPTPEQMEAQTAATEKALRAKYGEAFEAKLNAARSVIDRLPAKERDHVRELLNRSGLGSSPWLIERLIILAEQKATGRGVRR